ncbi:MAG: hypothetical protein AAFP92_25585, partial [Bacteroidota bacterium]
MKKTMFLGLLLCLLTACQAPDKQPDQEAAIPDSQALESPDTKAVSVAEPATTSPAAPWSGVVSPPEGSLAEQLAFMVKQCHDMVMDEEMGSGEFDEKIDAAAQGYLRISGGWPTCGCNCTSTAGAYRKADGSYLLLSQEQWPCSYRNIAQSSENWDRILPEGFGIKTFLSEGGEEVSLPDQSMLRLQFEIPQKGTQTQLDLKWIPLGLQFPSSPLIGTSMDQDLHSTYLGDFWELVESVKVGESLMAMKDNRPDEISQEDRQPYTEALQELSAEEIADYLGTLFQAYQIYS